MTTTIPMWKIARRGGVVHSPGLAWYHPLEMPTLVLFLVSVAVWSVVASIPNLPPPPVSLYDPSEHILQMIPTPGRMGDWTPVVDAGLSSLLVLALGYGFWRGASIHFKKGRERWMNQSRRQSFDPGAFVLGPLDEFAPAWGVGDYLNIATLIVSLKILSVTWIAHLDNLLLRAGFVVATQGIFLIAGGVMGLTVVGFSLACVRDFFPREVYCRIKDRLHFAE